TFTRNTEDLVVWQDPLYPHDFPSIFLPRNPKNWERASMSMVTQEDVIAVEAASIEIATRTKTETEFFYETSAFLASSDITERANQFKRLYEFEVVDHHSKEALVEFFNLWEKQKDREQDDLYEKESRGLFFFCLEHLDEYKIQQVYVLVDGKLAGFAWGVCHPNGGWVGLHLKVDYAYKGLSRFLHVQRARMFESEKRFSLGTGCKEPGLIQFKRELHPIEERQYFYLFTREKKE
ncbi:MAG: hypothetical protein NUV84_03825, partial [Candidatus Uhrbacteria bacterium]|nr:hypothetical protein [Candidatus Uhrbacteria bacterium]